MLKTLLEFFIVFLILSIICVWQIWLYSKFILTKENFGSNEPSFGQKSAVQPSLEDSDHQIFFIETICGEQYNCAIKLSDRKLCAIESTARLHPHHKIFVLIVNPAGFAPSDNLDLIKKVANYANVYFREINLMEYAQNSPLEDFFANKRYIHSFYMRTHLADVLRMVTMWKYGGTCFDSDIICLKNIEVLGWNWAPAEDDYAVQNSMINFGSDKLGRKMAEECLVELNNTFNGTEWAENGPLMITRVLARLCKTEMVERMTEERCQGFKVLPNVTFAPLHWSYADLYFDEEYTNEVMDMVKDAYVAHTFNHMTSELKVNKSSNVTYALLAKEFCPDTFNSPRNIF